MAKISLKSVGTKFRVVENGNILSLYDDDYLVYRSSNLKDFVQCCLLCSYCFYDFDTIECVDLRPAFRNEFNSQKNVLLTEQF